MTARRAAPALVAALAAAAVLAGCAADATGSSDTPASKSSAARPPAGTPSAKAASATAPDGTLLVADFGGDTVSFVDPERGAFARVEVGTAPYGVAVGADGRAWVATAEGVAVVDTKTRTRLARIPYETATGPITTGEYRGGGMGIALAPDGRHVYVGVNVPDADGVLEVIDTATREVTETAPVGRRPFDVDVSRDGAEVYATGHDSFDVTAVRTGTDTGTGTDKTKDKTTDTLRTRRMEVAPYGTEGGLGSWLKPHYAVVRPADGKLLLPFEGERLAVLDPRTGKVTVERMTANTHQHGAALTPDGTLLVVGTGPIAADDEDASLTVRSPDGTERVVKLDGPHEDVAVSGDGSTAYVTGGFTQDGYWNGITVVDLDGKAPPVRLAAGERPLGIAVL